MNWFDNSKLFDLARRGLRLTHIAAVIPLSLIFIIVGQFGIIPVIAALALIYGPDAVLQNTYAANMSNTLAGLWMGLQLIFSYLLLYVILWAWLKWYEKRPFWTMGYEWKNALMQYGRGFLLGALTFGGAVGILAALGALSFEQGAPAKQGLLALPGVLAVLIGWVVQGGGEEIIMRGWVLPVIGARYKPWLGLLISSLIFSALHGMNSGVSALALFNIALFGAFAGLYAMREGSLWGISAFHSVWNWVQGNFFGFLVSGQNAAGGSLIRLSAHGADWLTGGEFGPEGGLAVTIVLVVGILLVLFWKKGKDLEVANDSDVISADNETAV
ncbi:MAG: CPBP family intramembrane metalloprotease [Anaerolineales bacterium]|nr:CPBP family intramembrane metalloprotease [Anaerolineales bacterium]